MPQHFNVKLPVTQNEMDIVKLLADGYTVKEAADKFGSNPRTLEHRIIAMRNKYFCPNTVALVALFLRNKFIE